MNIDAAAVRSVCFNEKIYVSLPDTETRLFMIKKYLNGCPLSDDIDYDILATMTEYFSGADINKLVDRAKEKPLLDSIACGFKVKIAMSNIVNAISIFTHVNDEQVLKQYENIPRENTYNLRDNNEKRHYQI